MYKKLARYYDVIYSWKDYEGESKKIKELIEKHKKNSGRDLLEVAFGTGGHAQFLQEDYQITGVDQSRDMLAVAREKYPDLELLPDDMSDFDLGRKFDILLCLFSSIGYLKNYRNLKKALQCFAHHLKPGGVLIIEPFIDPDEYITGGPPHAVYIDQGDFNPALPKSRSRPEFL